MEGSVLERGFSCRSVGEGWWANGPGWGVGRCPPDSLNMAFSLKKQLMKLSNSMIKLSFAYLATSTCVTLLFSLMPGRERGAEGESPALWPLPPLCYVGSLSRARLFATPWTAIHQVPLSMRFSRQGYWPSPQTLSCP